MDLPRASSPHSLSDAAVASFQTGSSSPSKQDRSATKRLPYYKAKVIVPVSLPTTKSFFPTFHSCLVSRVYLLDLTVSVHPPATSKTTRSVSSTTVQLKIPLQIASHGNRNARPLISEEEAAHIAQREADVYLEPRAIVLELPDGLGDLPSPIRDPLRGTRGSVFTHAGSPDGSDASEGEGALPPSYTRSSRTGTIMH